MIKGLGEKLKMARLRAGLTQGDVYELTGISQSTISAYEKDAVDDPSSASLRKLASIYRVPIDYLLGEETRQILVVDDLNEDQFKHLKFVLDQFAELNRIKESD